MLFRSRGALQTSNWSETVCFAGVGPGEIVSGARKVLGISQRRTRDIARFQCALYRHWDAEALVSLLSPPTPASGDLADLVLPVDLHLSDLLAALPS